MRSRRHQVCSLLGLVVLALVLWSWGADPFLTGLRALALPTLALGALLAVPTTCACAWRWHLVARGLGVSVGPAAAVASCYRAQFLNTVLPGGVLGDVHRGVRHGRLAGDTGRGLRAVVWERTAGQVVLLVVTAGALTLLPSPVRASALGVVGVVLVLAVALGTVVLGLGLGLGLGPRAVGVVPSWARRVTSAARDDVRHGLLARSSWPGVLVASTLALAGHLATFLLAARAVGVTASTARLLPLALLVLVAAGLPTNAAGWGPREGVAAWTFGAAGLGADLGLSTAVAYGAIVAVASVPGAVVLAVGASRRDGRRGGRREAAATSALGAWAAGGPARG